MSGLNTKIEHKGIHLHVQTQDKGMKAQYVESLIYATGKVLTSRKTPYTPILNSPDLEIKINQIIKDQHEKILREIAEGKFDHFLKLKEEPGSG